MLTLNGCASTDVKIVQIDSFCTGKYESLWLEHDDYFNIDQIRKDKTLKITIDKFITQLTINEKEYELCPKN